MDIRTKMTFNLEYLTKNKFSSIRKNNKIMFKILLQPKFILAR